MFFKTRKATDLQKLDAIVEYLNDEMTRWQNTKTLASHLAGEEWFAKVDARIMYLEEQIALMTARRAVEVINPHKK